MFETGRVEVPYGLRGLFCPSIFWVGIISSVSSRTSKSSSNPFGRFGFPTSPSSWLFSSTELARDLSVVLELTLSKDSLVIISSRVDAAIGKAVRIDVRELLGSVGSYLLGVGEILGPIRGVELRWSKDCLLDPISEFLFEEGGK